MIINKTDSYTLLKDERADYQNFASYLERVIPAQFSDDHLVIDLSEFDGLSLEELLLMLKISTYHRSTKHSFVIISTAVDVDDIPAELVVVPTLQEAGDIVEMEAIERDLGF